VLNSEIICVYKYLKQNSELFDFIILSDPKNWEHMVLLW